jgi:hypothetical protein
MVELLFLKNRRLPRINREDGGPEGRLREKRPCSAAGLFSQLLADGALRGAGQGNSEGSSGVEDLPVSQHGKVLSPLARAEVALPKECAPVRLPPSSDGLGGE